MRSDEHVSERGHAPCPQCGSACRTERVLWYDQHLGTQSRTDFIPDATPQPASADVVDDAMVERYVNAVGTHLGGLTPKDWEVERFDPAASIRRVARIGLTAAIKGSPQ
jgi:hypothetical protein